MKNKKRRRNLNWSAGAPLGAGRSPINELERKTAHDTVYFTPPGKNEYYFHSCLKFLVYIQVLFS